MRGLKWGLVSQQGVRDPVAPFTGAWIEIRIRRAPVAQYLVAPFTGAWIEMATRFAAWLSQWVAPFTGAWIEICRGVGAPSCPSSHPSRVRGLKWKLFDEVGPDLRRTLHGCVD